MQQEILNRYLEIQERALHDERYMRIYGEYRKAQKQFLTLIENLDTERQDVLLAYIGACGDLHFRLMELACE